MLLTDVEGVIITLILRIPKLYSIYSSESQHGVIMVKIKEETLL